MVVKAGEYGSVRCRVLNGSKGSFSWSFILSSVPFSIDLDILDFFQTVPIPFLSFLPGGPRTCRGLNRPRLCPKTILYLYYRAWAITFLGSDLGPQWINGSGPQIIGPHNSPSKFCCPTSWLERRVLVTPSLYYSSFNSVLY